MEKHKKLKIVIDTNVLIVSISSKSQTHWIFQKLVGKEYDVFITNEILTEYEEIIERKMNDKIRKYVVDILLNASNVYKTFTYFNWNLITVDPDDNKFVDCAVACNADYILTNDSHLNILKSIDFPKVNIINPDDFKKLFP